MLFLKDCDFVGQHGQLNCYQANIQKPEYGMLSHLPENLKTSTWLLGTIRLIYNKFCCHATEIKVLRHITQ